jgi:hypothetical protein
MKNTPAIMLLILLAAALIEVLTFSVLLFGFPSGMEPEAALYVNSILAMFVVLASSIWLVIYLLEKRRMQPR